MPTLLCKLFDWMTVITVSVSLKEDILLIGLFRVINLIRGLLIERAKIVVYTLVNLTALWIEALKLALELLL